MALDNNEDILELKAVELQTVADEPENGFRIYDEEPTVGRQHASVRIDEDFLSRTDAW